MAALLALAATRVFLGALALCALAALLHVTTDDEDGGWLLLTSVCGVVMTAAAGVALVADHPVLFA